VRRAVQSRFAYVLVDEFQDTNRAQLELLRLVSRENFANVTVVGDDKQAIYEWRGARIENLREFAAQERFLTFNYRSCNEILDLANHSIAQDPYFAGQREQIRLSNPQRGYSEGGRIHLVRLGSREEEASYIAGELDKLIAAGVKPGEIAVLYRSTTHTAVLERELRRLGIPYTALGAGFFEREEVRDVLACLRLVCQPEADDAVVRVLERPPLSLSQGVIAGIAARRRSGSAKGEERGALLDVLEDEEALGELTSRQREAVSSMLSCIKNLRSICRTAPLPVLVESAFRQGGYYEQLLRESPTEMPRSISNISKMIDVAADFHGRSVLNGLPEFVRYMERLVRMGDVRETEADPQEETEAVKLLTTFKAKGLEFHAVFAADVRHNKFRKEDAYLLELAPASEEPGGCGLVAKYTPGSGKERPDYDELLAKRGARARHEQEERRIFHVALTRAKENLYVTTSAPDSPLIDELLQEFSSNSLVEVIDTI
jgi:DNA helicase-2/ATP-dependent DNA helicase PcrA